MNRTVFLYNFLLLIAIFSANGQNRNPEDSIALEDVFVEEYYHQSKNNATDTALQSLPKKVKTYRIYVDLKPGYFLQAIYGVPGHELKFKTSSYFFNDTINGQVTGDQINSKLLNTISVALDSWLTLGAASDEYFGIPLKYDNNNSVLKFASLNEKDGLFPKKIANSIIYFGVDLNTFKSNHTSLFSTTNGSIANIRGVEGVDDNNRILIAQLTTSGEISFELNLQVISASGKVQRWVAKNPANEEKTNKKLTFN